MECYFTHVMLYFDEKLAVSHTKSPQAAESLSVLRNLGDAQLASSLFGLKAGDIIQAPARGMSHEVWALFHAGFIVDLFWTLSSSSCLRDVPWRLVRAQILHTHLKSGPLFYR